MQIMTLMGYLLETEQIDADRYDDAVIINLTHDEAVRYLVPILKNIADPAVITNLVGSGIDKKYGLYIGQNGISEMYCVCSNGNEMSFNVFDKINRYAMANGLYGIYILMCSMLVTKEFQM